MNWLKAMSTLGLVCLMLATLSCGRSSGGTSYVTTGGDTVTTPPNLQDLNVTDFHKNISSTTDYNLCISCHGDMTTATTLDPDIKEYHHRKSILLAWRCTDCHGPVDLIQGSGANLRKQVDVENKCTSCHNATGGATQFYR